MFENVLEALLAGQEVRRASWSERKTLFYRDGRYHMTSKALVDDALVSVVVQITLASLGDDLLANDWEVVPKGEAK